MQGIQIEILMFVNSPKFDFLADFQIPFGA